VQASSSVSIGVSTLNNMSSLLLSRLVPGEKSINITTKSVNVTLNKNLPERLFDQPLKQGSAQCLMPTDWCSIAPAGTNCTNPQPISVKVMLSVFLKDIYHCQSFERELLCIR
jgi:hypothetical protein